MIVHEAKYEISSLLINSQGRIGLYALLNLLQDVGWSHAHSLGHGHHDTAGRKAMWVLTRQRLQMSSWPDWGNSLKLKTWLRPAEGVFANRDYEIWLASKAAPENFEKIGEATSSFLLLHTETRKPLREDLSKLGFPTHPEKRVSFDAEKIPPQENSQRLTSFQVRNSDIDMNQHVNNTRYAQWILDAVPFSSHSQFRLHEYEICFIAETRVGDVIVIEESLENDDSKPGTAFFQGKRETDGKVAFTAKLHLTQT